LMNWRPSLQGIQTEGLTA